MNEYDIIEKIDEVYNLYKQGNIQKAYGLLSEIEEIEKTVNPRPKMSELISMWQYMIGKSYYYGDNIKKNPHVAVELLVKAKNRGHPEAHNLLGECYYLGKGIEQNYALAFENYYKTANQGNMIAQNNLGFLLTEKNHELAIYWYSEAAKQGDKEAKKELRRLKSKFKKTHFLYILVFISALLLGIMIDNKLAVITGGLL